MRSSDNRYLVTALSWLIFLGLIAINEIHQSITSCTILGVIFLFGNLFLLRQSFTTTPEPLAALPPPPTIATKPIVSWVEQYDSLTALPNRIFFNELLSKAINHAKRRNKIIALININIDKFKNVNTTYSVAAGDLVLKEAAKRISAALRSEDVLAKLDGDEFIILLNDIGKPKFASAVAEKILQAFIEPFKIDSHLMKLTVSMGISIYPNDGESLEILIRNVDTTLFKVKRAGGASYQFYTEELENEAREYILLKTDLMKAIQNHEFALYYQPKMHIKKGTIIGVEALLRWIHPTLGILYPGKFIPVAEEAGLIGKIGEWALREACEMNKFWQNEGYQHLIVSLNLSSKQFEDPNFPALVKKITEETELNPNFIEFEVSEQIIMDDVEKSKKTLDALKSTGVQISIDHFGTGATSISHLKQLPINLVKIDHQFIKGTPNIPDDTAITNAMIALCHNLGFEVVAEGVETFEQMAYLTSQQCDIVQGYFLSHPAPADKIALQFKKLSEEVII